MTTASKRTFKKIIFDDLKKRGLSHIMHKIKSVRYSTFSMGNSVDVSARNLFKNERETLEKILKEYQYGRFDAMTDCQYSETDPTKERQAKYVSLQHEWDDSFKRVAKMYLEREYGVCDDESAQKKLGVWYDTAWWRLLNELENFEQMNGWAAKPNDIEEIHAEVIKSVPLALV